MNKLCRLLQCKSDDELFNKITSSFKEKITQWDYFVNWKKVLENIGTIEKELNILNYLIGKKNLKVETYKIIKEYPQTIKAFPILLAIREKSIQVLINTENFICKNYDFEKEVLTDKDYKDFTEYIIKSGFGELLKDRKIKNLVDYVTGVEVGLDSNGRKNRGGKLMETIVESYIAKACEKMKIEYMSQATADKIKKRWGLNVKVDKSSRIIDFAINNNGKLFFIECNFYGGGGSKLKSTATEYIEMNRHWREQNIEFIWITDGAGWISTSRPLRDYFDKTDYLINLELLRNNILSKIFN
jgi:type II restriction enzyme